MPEHHAAAPPSPSQVSDGVHNALTAQESMELENYRLLTSEVVRQVAKAGPLSPADWKNAFKQKPTKIGS